MKTRSFIKHKNPNLIKTKFPEMEGNRERPKDLVKQKKKNRERGSELNVRESE